MKPLSPPPLRRLLRGVLSWGRAALAVLLGLWLLVEPMRIPSDSMEPVLHGAPGFFDGDRILVNKLVFGPRIPFTTKRIYRLGNPQRWDIVVFRAAEGDGKPIWMVKRVIGLPGERVRIKDGAVYINDELAKPPAKLRDTLRYTEGLEATREEGGRLFLDMARNRRLPEMLSPDNPNVMILAEELAAYVEALQGERVPDDPSPEELETLVKGLSEESQAVLRDTLCWPNYTSPPQYGLVEDDARSLVPEGCYFVLGDNSPHSVDGRFFGWVPHEDLAGRAFCVFWPLSRIRDLTGFTSTFTGWLLLLALPGATILYECRHMLLKRFGVNRS